MEYYTYAYLRKDKTPYYIGKGSGMRAWVKADRVTPKPSHDRILVLKTGLTEEEAFKHEIYMIAVYGRKDLGTGILRNRTDGGDGWSGAKHSKETLKKLSKMRKGKIPKNLKQAQDSAKVLNQKPLTLVSNKTNEVLTFNSQTIAAKHFKVKPENFSRLAAGKIKTVKGWRLATP